MCLPCTPLLSVRKIKDSLLRQLRFLQIPRNSYFYQPGRNGCEEEGRLVLMTTSQKKKKKMLNILSSFNSLTIFLPMQGGRGFQPITKRQMCVLYNQSCEKPWKRHEKSWVMVLNKYRQGLSSHL